jgi:hypothetical protein
MSDPKSPGDHGTTGVVCRKERRAFLKLGATAGVAVAAAGSVSCAGLGAVATSGPALAAPPLSERALRRYLGEWDRGMRGIATWNATADLLPREYRDEVWLASLGAETAVTRKALGALYFSAMYNDLPPASRAHPAVVKRLARATPELDDAVFTMTGALKAMSKADLRQVQHHLTQHPDAGMQICELFEGQAKTLGLSLSRRLQTRALVSGLSWRLRAQPPSLLIDDCVAKVQKVAARSGQAEQLQRYFAHTASNAAFWAYQRRLAALETPPQERLRPMQAPPPPPPLEKEPANKPGPGQPLVNAGLVLLGMSLGASAVGGLLLSSAGIAGAFVLTAAGVLLLSGLITLWVGAARNAGAR